MSVFGKVAIQRSLFVVVAALMVAAPALATPLGAGENQWYTHPEVAGVPPYNIGPVGTGGGAGFEAGDYEPLLDNLNNPVVLVSNNMGQLQGQTTTRVYRSKTDGTLAFSYTVDASQNNTRYIVRATLDGATWAQTVIRNTGADPTGASGTGVAVAEWNNGSPVFIARSEYSPNAPEWQFQMPRVPVLPNNPALGTVIGPGDRSAEVWFTTNVTDWTTGFVAYLDSGATGRAEVLIPVPDPASLALIGLATGGLALFRRRRTA